MPRSALTPAPSSITQVTPRHRTPDEALRALRRGRRPGKTLRVLRAEPECVALDFRSPVDPETLDLEALDSDAFDLEAPPGRISKRRTRADVCAAVLGVLCAWFRERIGHLRRALTPLHVGIDLGTANTLITVRGQGIVLNEPSMVAVRTDDGAREVVAVGKDAKAMLGRTPRGVEVLRPLRDGVIADFEVAQALIEHLLRQVTGHSIVRPRVVICVPCGATQMERRAIAEAAERVGARSVELIDEPVAAAIGAGLPVTSAEGSMVVDIGGGTTEIAVLSLGGVAYTRSVRVGGDLMDEAIVSWVRREHATLLGLATAERIKIQIGDAQLDPSAEQAKDRRLKVRGLALVEGLPHEVELTHAEVAHSLSQPVATVVEAVKQALANTPPDLAADVAEHGIHLTGGGALLHGLADAIAAGTRLKVSVAKAPLTCVVRGTGSVLDDPALHSFARAA